MNAAAPEHFELRRQAPRQGTCDLCGEWDGALLDGVGSCCRGKNSVKPRTHAPTAGRMLPCNAHQWNQLTRALSVLLLLDEQRCLVLRIESGGSEPVIVLARAPGDGIPGMRAEIVRKTPGGTERVMRLSCMDCVLEWAP